MADDEWMAEVSSEIMAGREERQAQAGALARINSVLESDRAGQWGLLASLSVSLGRIGDALEEQKRRAERDFNERAANLPIWHDFALNLKAPTSGVVTFNLGGPSVGRIWHVKRLVVGGLTLATAAAGTAEAYATGWIPDAISTGTPTSLSDLMDATILISAPQTDLPNIGNYEDGQFVVQSREKLWVVIRGATSGQFYVAAGTAKDMRDQAHEVDAVVG